MEAWVVCPRCHFSQAPAERCRRCGEVLAVAAPPPVAPPPVAPLPPAPPRPGPAHRGWVAAAAIVALLTAVWLGRSDRNASIPGPSVTPIPTSGPLDLSGRWHVQYSKTFGTPPRPVLKEIAIESGPDGAILAARVAFTDPGRGGAGAGYRTASDGPKRLSDAQTAMASSPAGSALNTDFLQLPGWIPERPRVWRAVEGASRADAGAPYLLVESLETGVLLQAGINGSGFLSYVFFSPSDAPPRGQDALSRVIHPEPGASLRGFQNLIWDLSGAADFVKMQLPVTISGPEGGAPDSVTLTR